MEDYALFKMFKHKAQEEEMKETNEPSLKGPLG